jgi:hypothetical protein
MSAKPVESYNAASRDLGPANDYTISGPIARVKENEAVSTFCAAICTQGQQNIRQQSITKMMERARSNAALPDKAFRILDRIAHNCRGEHRYSFEPHDTLAFYCGLATAKNFNRYLRVLLHLEFIARFALRRPTGGHPIPIYTVICSSEDRTGVGRRHLREMALARRRNGPDSPRIDGPPLSAPVEECDLFLACQLEG